MKAVEKNYFKTLHDLCMNIGGRSMFTFTVGIIHGLQMKSNQIASQPFIKSTSVCLAFLSENVCFVFHIITEVNAQHVGTYPAFAGQNLKFTRQMTNDKH